MEWITQIMEWLNSNVALLIAGAVVAVVDWVLTKTTLIKENSTLGVIVGAIKSAAQWLLGRKKPEIQE